MRKWAIAMAGVLLLFGAAGAFVYSAGWLANGDRTVKGIAFTEVQWPFPIDQWGKGKAFLCAPADCGTQVTLYIRAKIGFCNCTTGVADDEELERISDFELFDSKFSAQGDGRPIAVAWMKGRSRPYAYSSQKSNEGRRGKSALAIGYNDRCDAIVATALLQHDRPGDVEAAVISFLNGPTVMRWAEATLGL